METSGIALPGDCNGWLSAGLGCALGNSFLPSLCGSCELRNIRIVLQHRMVTAWSGRPLACQRLCPDVCLKARTSPEYVIRDLVATTHAKRQRIQFLWIPAVEEKTLQVENHDWKWHMICNESCSRPPLPPNAMLTASVPTQIKVEKNSASSTLYLGAGASMNDHALINANVCA